MKLLSIPYKVKHKNGRYDHEYVCLITTDNNDTYILNVEVSGDQFTDYYLLMNDLSYLHSQFKYMPNNEQMETHLLESLQLLINRNDIIHDTVHHDGIHTRQFNRIYWTKEGWNTIPDLT